MDHVHWLIMHYGYVGIFFALALGIVGLPIPDEVLLTYVGYSVFKGVMEYPPALLGAFAGAATGITVSYAIGRKLGLPFLKKVGPTFHITEERVAYTQKLFAKCGNCLLIIGYFIPGVRHITAYLAGIAGMDVRRFMAFAYTGAFLWSLSFITLGRELGEKWYIAGTYLHRFGFYLPLVALVLAAGVVFYVMRKRSKPTS